MEATGDSSRQNALISILKNQRLALVVAALASAFAALVVTQQYFGIGLTKTFEVGPAEFIHPDGKAWRWQLPKKYRDEIMDTRAVLLENGQPFLNHGVTNEHVREVGTGLHRFQGGQVRFAPADGSDPRTNGRRYEVVLPRQFRLLDAARLGLLLGLCFIWVRWTRRQEESSAGLSWKIPVWVQTIVIFIVAFAVLVGHMRMWPPHTDNSQVLHGVPESDSMAWHEMGQALPEGRGLITAFESSRPLYPVIMAPVYALSGGTLDAAKLMNALLVAAAVAGVWLLALVLRQRWLAVGGAAAVLLAEDHLNLPQFIMTESAGLMLAVLSLLAVLVAIWHLAPGWSALAGVINGFSVLACGFTMLTLPFYAALFVLDPLLRRAPWRRALLLGVLFTLGASAVVLPWMIRQKIKHGRFALTLASGDLLYAGAHSFPGGGLGKAVFEHAQAQGANTKDTVARFDYFMGEFRAIVKADPKAWAGKVATATLESLSYIRINDAAFRTAAILTLLGAAVLAGLRGGGIAPLVIAVALGTAWLRLESADVLLVFLVCLALAFRRARWPEERLALTLVAVTVVCVAVLDGISGNQMPRRLWSTASWGVTLVILLGLVRAVEIGSSLLDRVLSRLKALQPLAGAGRADTAPRQIEAVSLPVKAGSAVCALHITAAIVFSLAATASGPRAPFPRIGEFDAAAATAKLLPIHPDPRLRAEHPKIRAIVGRLDDMIVPLRAGEDLNHWLPHYERRSYDRLVARVALLADHGVRNSWLMVTVKGSLDAVPRGTPLLWITADHSAMNTIKEEMVLVLEAIAAVPLKPDPTGQWQPDVAGAQWFEPTPEALAALGN